MALYAVTSKVWRLGFVMSSNSEGNRLPWLREGSSCCSSARPNGCRYRDCPLLSTRCTSVVNPSLRDMATFKGKIVLLNNIFYINYVHKNLLCPYYYYYYYYYFFLSFFLLYSSLISCLSILLTYWPCMTLLSHIIIIIIVIIIIIIVIIKWVQEFKWNCSCWKTFRRGMGLRRFSSCRSPSVWMFA